VNPYRTKLTFAARCAIFAGHWHKSYNYPELALAFGVNEETIGKICRANGRSRHYKDVFRESNNLGVERMWGQYSEKIDIEKRIENARMERGTRNPHIPEYYVDTGPGTYYLKNSKGAPVAVKIKHVDEILKADPDATVAEGADSNIGTPNSTVGPRTQTSRGKRSTMFCVILLRFRMSLTICKRRLRNSR